MRVLLLGKGGREHALAWKILQSKLLSKLFVAPGNAGIAQIAECIEPLEIPGTFASEYEWNLYLQHVIIVCSRYQITFVVTCTEDILAHGLVDAIQNSGLLTLVFGPTQRAAEIESSKLLMKVTAGKAGVPSSKYKEFDILGEATQYVRSLNLSAYPIVIKESNLSAGKGVTIAHNEHEALEAVLRHMSSPVSWGKGRTIIIEDFIEGDQELSLQGVAKGLEFLPFPASQDYKALGEWDKGPNTGGMGAYSPIPWLVAGEEEHLYREFALPLLKQLDHDDQRFTGVFYPGIKTKVKNGKAIDPYLLEVNCRLGDPETQVLLPRMQGDLLDLMHACASPDRSLNEVEITWDSRVAVCVVLCSHGYGLTRTFPTGYPIRGLKDLPEDILVFHSGTKIDKRSDLVTDGGRVLSLVVLAPTLEDARNKVYQATEKIGFEGNYYRPDIARL